MNNINDTTFAYKVSAFNRKRKWELFLKEIAPTERTRVLDVGFNEREHSSTSNFIEKYYPHPEMLKGLGVMFPKKFRTRYPKVEPVLYNGGTFPFTDKAFDVCWSNAVIEHVGNRNQQLFFLKEIKRVSKRAFITTPNRFFPIEVHTRTPLLHYLPKKIYDKYLVLIGQKWATGKYMDLLSHKEVKTLLSAADITEYKIVQNKLAGFTLDFVIIF